MKHRKWKAYNLTIHVHVNKSHRVSKFIRLRYKNTNFYISNGIYLDLANLIRTHTSTFSYLRPQLPSSHFYLQPYINQHILSLMTISLQKNLLGEA